MTRSPASQASRSARTKSAQGSSTAAACVGRWQLVQRAAEGALTEIYQARSAEAAHDSPPAYAVKLLKPDWRDDPGAIGLLKREAAVSAAVRHRHLVPVLAAQLNELPHYVVMPWLCGASLGEWLARGEGHCWSLPAVLWVMRQVAEALAALHEQGWLHGDVKPTNVIVSPECHTTLIDLGFARRRDEAHGPAERCVAGTLDYIAPETVTSSLGGDHRSDLYSLGVTLFEAISGRRPFHARDAGELVRLHRESAAPRLDELVPDLPPALVELVRQMIAKDPLRRPQSAREVIDRLLDLEIETFRWRRPLTAVVAARDS